jgi:hypothetical protein
MDGAGGYARSERAPPKSEYFRFAARLGDCAGPDAKIAFVARRNALAERAERVGLTPLADPVPK